MESGLWTQQPVPCCAQVKCCGWVSFYNWTENAELMNRTEVTYPCSCEDKGDEDDGLAVAQGFCEGVNATQSGNNLEHWPVYKEVCPMLRVGRKGQGPSSGTGLSAPPSVVVHCEGAGVTPGSGGPSMAGATVFSPAGLHGEGAGVAAGEFRHHFGRVRGRRCH